MKNIFSSLGIILCISCLLPSCMTARVVSQYNSNTIANNPNNDTTVWIYFWGLKQPNDINPKCNPQFNHLNMVATKTNFGFILISAITLGIAVPVKIEWACAPPDEPIHHLGN